jgi:23S rRNA (cytidine1920-2'-O)/16S rRNA (cytidine1409-2'-O)-methyltransferase
VIRDPEIHRRALGEVASALGSAGAVIMGAMPSPITGSAGNIEFLLYARTPPAGGPDLTEPTRRPGLSAAVTGGDSPPDVELLLDAAVTEAHRPDLR